MIVVTDIKYMVCQEDQLRIAYMEKQPISVFGFNHEVEKINVTNEVIRGRYFVNNKGDEVCLSYKKDIQDLLGLPFEVFENLSNDIKILQGLNFKITKEKDKEEAKLKTFLNMSFWDRLKFLFTGKVKG